MPEYTGYKDDVDPSAVTEFTTAAFRFGAWLMKRSALTLYYMGVCVRGCFCNRSRSLGH